MSQYTFNGLLFLPQTIQTTHAADHTCRECGHDHIGECDVEECGCGQWTPVPIGCLGFMGGKVKRASKSSGGGANG